MTDTSSKVQRQLSGRTLGIVLTAALLIVGISIVATIEWQGSPLTHAILEMFSACLIGFCGIIALSRYYHAEGEYNLGLSVGFFGTAVLDGYHAIVASSASVSGMSDDLHSVVPWTWLASRMLLACTFLICFLVWHCDQTKTRSLKSLPTTLPLAAAALVLIVIALLANAQLPDSRFQQTEIPRPIEFVPAILFLIALAGHFFKSDWRHDDLNFWLLLALVSNLVSQSTFMAFSEKAFDTHFAAAHVFKLIAYAFILTGFVFKMYQAARIEAQEGSARLRAILDTVVDGVVGINANGTIEVFNPAAEEIFNYSSDEVLGSNITQLIPEFGTVLELKAQQSRTVQTYQPFANEQELEGRRKDGTGFSMEMTINELEVGGSSSFTIIFRDVSERKASLERLINAREEADRANRAKSEFLAKMSHEIRTPMHGVIGMADVIHRTNLKGYQVEMVDLIRQSAHSLLSIIDDILDYSKLEASKIELSNESLAISDVVGSVCSMLNSHAIKSGVEITLFTDPAIPDAVLGDKQRLRQVLINLISNAIKFSSKLDRPGRVCVRVMLRHKYKNQVQLEFLIIDNGIGIDKAIQSQLFTPFTQADSSTSRQFGGTGLGLSISKQLSELMGGELEVASEVGQGSTFTVSLPFTKQARQTNDVLIDAGIAELQCIVIGNEDGIANDLALYLKHDGAVVAELPDLASISTWSKVQPIDDWILIIDANGQKLSRQDIQAAADLSQQENVRVKSVVIERGQRLQARQEDSGIVRIDANALGRVTFLNTVGVAAGLLDLSAVVQPSSENADVQINVPTRAEALRDGSLILVAEDNEISQKVILQQLAFLGYTADVAATGKEAISLWRSINYAMLITDLNMPEMSGLELTKVIRTEESPEAHLPILGLSANPISETDDSCLSAGMDECLSKPTQLDDLKAALANLLPALNPATAFDQRKIDQRRCRPDSTLSDREDRVPVDLNVLRKMVGDYPTVISDFLQEFRTGITAGAAELRDAQQAGDPESAARVAHKIKASCRYVGALALGDLCEEIERAGKVCETNTLAEVLPRFDEELQAVKKFLATR